MVSEDGERDVQLVNRTFLWAAVFLDGLHHIILNSDIVDNKASILAIKHTVDTGNRLDERMLLQRLIDVHYSEGRNIKAGDPHVNNNGDPEIGIVVLELAVQHLAIFFCATKIIEFLLVVLALCRHHIDHRQSDEFIKLLTGELIFVLGLFLYEPFRADCFDGLKHFKCKRPVGADDHSFLYDFRLFGAEGFIVGNDICCQLFEPIRMTKDCRHAAHSPFAFLDLLRIGAFGSTLLIVLLDFFGLFVRNNNTG